MGENELMLVLGSTSEIAWATVQRLAQDKGQHWRFFLTGRNLTAVRQQAQQLAAATKQEVFFGYFDAMDDLEQHERLWRCVVPAPAVEAAMQHEDRQTPVPACTPVVYSVLPDGMVQAAAAPSVSDRAGHLGAVFCAVGYLGQREQVQDLAADAEHERVWRCNYSGLLPLLNRAAMYFEQRGYGKMLVISSVAGERGRCSNFFYGAAKAAMTAYLSGLRVRLMHSHRECLRQQARTQSQRSLRNRYQMQVLTILPGYVRTKMVSGRKLPPLITATPEQVAADIVRAMGRGQDVLYTIWVWRYIMLVTRHIPECVFKRLHMF